MPAASKKQQQLFASYAAGFFDGEGHITIRRANQYLGGTPSYRCCIGATNRDEFVLQMLQATYGGKIYSKVRYSPAHNQAYEWFLQNTEEVRAFLTDIEPYCLIKVPQVRLGLEFLSLGKMQMIVTGTRRIHPDKGGSSPILKAVEEDVQIRESFKQDLTELNRRGTKCLQ